MNIVFFGATELEYNCCEALLKNGYTISGIFTIKQKFNLSYLTGKPVKYKLGILEQELKTMDENTVAKKKIYRQFDYGKNVLRKAMKDFIPNSIIEHKKQGFSAPDESWFRGENARYVKELLLGTNLACKIFFNQDYIFKIVNEHINEGVKHRLLIWSFMNFEWWCKILINKD